jgi:hypothetical protein
MKPYDFKWTKFFNENIDFQNTYPDISLRLSEGELVICSTIIDADNYSVLTTRQLITSEKGALSYGDVQEASDKLYGDFKGYKTDSYTFGQIQLKDGRDLKYFIEVGKASMIMIHGVRTLIATQPMTSAQVDTVTKAWIKKSEE